jgi:hypothetical protein
VHLGDCGPRQLVRLRGAEVGLYGAFNNVTIGGGRSWLALGIDVFGEKPVRQFRNGRRPTLIGLLARWIAPMSHRR